MTALFDAEIVIERDRAIPNRYGSNIPVGVMNIRYDTNGGPENVFATPTELLDLSQNDVREGQIKIIFNEGTTVGRDILNRLLENFPGRGYQKFQIETDDETIDLIEQTVTKKSFIDLEDEELNNPDVIKEKLIIILENEF